MSSPAVDRTKAPADARPTFFNLFQIQLPVGALTSIAHRVTGIALAVATPFAVYLLGLSLRGPDGYAEASALFARWWLRLAAAVVVWALSHHLLAGLRHLLMDVDVGSRLAAARRSAWAVNVAGVALGLLAAAAWL
jgi:succinate dehydrogenase / fumarate reductase cytochrome b subunit